MPRFSLIRPVFLFYRTGNKVKEGKTFQFWGLCEDFQSVVVVGLGKKSKQRDDLELICEEKETARIAAAGMVIKITNKVENDILT